MLRPGAPVPPLSFPLVGGGVFDLEKARRDADYVLVEVYRGHHCSVCRAHLGQLATMKDELAALGASLVFASMNDADRARAAVDEWGLSELPVGYDLDEGVLRRWGVLISDRFRESEPERFAEPATFVVRRDGTLYAVDVRSSPHLRPQLDRLLTLVRRANEGYPPRGAA